jgi:hypothetical protein
MNTIELMLENLDKQIYENCKKYSAVLEKPNGSTFQFVTLAKTAHAALKEAQEAYPDCLVVQVTFNGKVAV